MNQGTSELILLNTRDNVAVARTALSRGRVIRSHVLTCTSDIPAGHKVALTPIAKDGPVYKYGALIGYAAQEIQKGDHVHSHNLYMRDVSREYSVGTDTVDTTLQTRPAARPSRAMSVKMAGSAPEIISASCQRSIVPPASAILLPKPQTRGCRTGLIRSTASWG